MEPREKPKMGKPKERTKSGQVIKDARSMLLEDYKKQAQDIDHTQGGAEYADEKLEGAARMGGRDIKRVGAHVRRTVRDKIKARILSEKQGKGAKRSTTGTTDSAPSQTRTSDKACTYAVKEQAIKQTADKIQQEQNKTKQTYTADRQKPAYRVNRASTRYDRDADRIKMRPQATTHHTIRQKRREDRPKEKSISPKSKPTGASAKAKKKTEKKARQEVQKQARQKAAQAAKTAAKQVKRLAVMIARAVVGAIKGILTVLGPVGLIATVFLLIAAVAATLASPFGMFYNDELDDGRMTISEAMGTISAEYSAEIHQIRGDNPHDTLELGNTAISNWRDILAVYAVKTTTAQDGMDVLTMDDEHLGLLRAVFWDMVEITHELEVTEQEETTTTIDENGTEIMVTVMVQKTVLHISVGLRTYADMLQQYSFDNEQRALLEELVGEEWDEQFDELLGTIGGGSGGGGSTGTISLGIYIWPSADSNYVTSFFGSRFHPIYKEWRTHSGIDIGAAHGTDILAAASGTVTYADWMSGYGNTVMIDHGNGNQTLYGHASSLNVSVGQTVTQGQVIALIGSTGNSTGPHLHFETRVNGSRVDPLLYFDNYAAAW